MFCLNVTYVGLTYCQSEEELLAEKRCTAHLIGEVKPVLLKLS